MMNSYFPIRFKSALIILFLVNCVTVFAQPLSGIFPKYAANVHQAQVTFQWNAMPGAVNYTVVLATDDVFTSNVTTSSPVTGTTWTSGTLPYGIWYWKVVGNNGTTLTESGINFFNHYIPTQNSNLSFWISADAGVSLDGNGRVQSWTDQSANAYTLTQADANKRPFTVASSFNGLPAINFQGAHWLTGGDILDIGTNSRTMFVMGNFNGNNQAFFAKSNSVSASSRYALMRLGTQTTVIYQEAADNHLICPTSTLSSALFNWENNRGTSLNKINLNNANIGVKAISPTYNFSSTFRFLLGAFNGSGDVGEAYLLNGNISEVVFVDNYSAADQLVVQKYFKHKYIPDLNLGADISNTSYCATTLTATNGYSSILWSTGQTTASINVSEPGSYWVRGTDQFGFVCYDTIYVAYPTIPSPPLTGICAGSSITWNANIGSGFTYLWNTGQSTSSLAITSPGNYYVKVTDGSGCFRYSDTVTFTLDNYANVAYLGADTSLCAGNYISLQVGADVTASYVWGNGSTGTSLLVMNSGTYNVQTVNVNGCSAQDTINVNIIGVAPLAQFAVSNECDQTAVNFTDQSVPVGASPIDGWQWQFGDGQNSTSPSPSYTYSAPGSYIVQLYVSQGGCGAYHYDTVQVFANPQVDFGYTGHCQGATIQFSNLTVAGSAPIQSYAWDFAMPWTGAYNTSTIPVPNRVFDTPGEYFVSFLVTDGNGCQDSIVQSVVIDPTPQTVIDVINSCQLSAADIVNLTPVEPGLIYNWNFGDNSFSILSNPTKTYDLYGTYIVTLDVTNTFGCVGTESQDIVVYPKPIALMDIGPACIGSYGSLGDISTVLSGSLDSTIWVINTTDTLYGANTAYPWSFLGQQQVQLTTFSSDGCSATASEFIDITETLSASFTPASVIVAAGDPIAFTNTSQGNGIYLWNFGDNTFSSQTDPSHSFGDNYIDSTLTVSLIAMNISGCIDTAFQSIQVLEPSLDLELSQLFVDEVDGWNVIGVRMMNTGTADITKASLVLRSQKGFLFNEVWEGVLHPQEDSIYVFNAKPVAGYSDQDQQDAFYCVDGVGFSANGQQEDDLTNNTVCNDIEGERVILLPVYPNPIDDVVNISLLVSVSSDVSIDLYDSRGRLVKSVLPSISLEPGVFSYNVNLSQVNAGAYFLRMTTSDGTNVEKLTVR